MGKVRSTQQLHVNDNTVSIHLGTDKRENWITNCHILSKAKHLSIRYYATEIYIRLRRQSVQNQRPNFDPQELREHDNFVILLSKLHTKLVLKTFIFYSNTWTRKFSVCFSQAMSIFYSWLSIISTSLLSIINIIFHDIIIGKHSIVEFRMS